MTVGEKIRKFRIDQGYTQKELAIMSGLSESAIRNYELGNRFPSSEQLEKIANSLKISPYAMSDPNFDTYVSVMHALFALEDQYGLHAYRDESGVPQLMFKDKGHDSLNMLDHELAALHTFVGSKLCDAILVGSAQKVFALRRTSKPNG